MNLADWYIVFPLVSFIYKSINIKTYSFNDDVFTVKQSSGKTSVQSQYPFCFKANCDHSTAILIYESA